MAGEESAQGVLAILVDCSPIYCAGFGNLFADDSVLDSVPFLFPVSLVFRKIFQLNWVRTPPNSNHFSYVCGTDQCRFRVCAAGRNISTISVALARTSSLIDAFDSSASFAAFHSSSATGGLCCTHVPKTSKKRTRRGGLAVILI